MPDSNRKSKPVPLLVPLAGLILLALAVMAIHWARGSAHNEMCSEGQPQTSASSAAPEKASLRILDTIYVQLDFIRVRLSPIGTPVSEWPVDAESYIRQVKETGAWPGPESRWPTDRSLDDPRTLVEVCRECEDYANERSPKHWETANLLHPYALRDPTYELDRIPLAKDVGVIVEMESKAGWYSAVLWRDGEPVEFGSLKKVHEAATEARQRAATICDGLRAESKALKEQGLEDALAANTMLDGRQYDVSQSSQGRIRVHVSEGKDDERLGYPLRTEEGLQALMESLGDALPLGTEIVVSSVDGKQDVVGCCISSCDFTEQPMVELSLERHGSEEEMENALRMPVTVPSELNGKSPYAWDVAVTRSRKNHDCGAVPRPVAIVRYGSPSDIEGTIIMGDFLLNDICDEAFADTDWGDFRHVNMRDGSPSRLSLHDCNETIRAEWYEESDMKRTFSYAIECRKTKDIRSEAAIDARVLELHGETSLGNALADLLDKVYNP